MTEPAPFKPRCVPTPEAKALVEEIGRMIDHVEEAMRDAGEIVGLSELLARTADYLVREHDRAQYAEYRLYQVDAELTRIRRRAYY